MKQEYESPILEIWDICFEKSILSGENNSSEPVHDEEGDIFG